MPQTAERNRSRRTGAWGQVQFTSCILAGCSGCHGTWCVYWQCHVETRCLNNCTLSFSYWTVGLSKGMSLSCPCSAWWRSVWFKWLCYFFFWHFTSLCAITAWHSNSGAKKWWNEMARVGAPCQGLPQCSGLDPTSSHPPQWCLSLAQCVRDVNHEYWAVTHIAKFDVKHQLCLCFILKG